MFFAPRSRIGTRFVFDDMKTYEMDKIAYVLTNFGFFTKEMGDDKCMLERTEWKILSVEKDELQVTKNASR